MYSKHRNQITQIKNTYKQMKKTFITLAAASLMAVSAFAQGTVVFANVLSATTHVFTNINNGAIRGQVGLTPNFLNYGLFIGSGGSGSNGLALANNVVGGIALVTTNSTSATGRFDGDAPGTFVGIQGMASGTSADVQIRAWSASYGNNWQSAYSAYQSGTAGAWWGASTVATITLNAAAGPGTPLFTAGVLTGFDVTTVPEPSTIALGMLGLASLAFLRRRNK